MTEPPLREIRFPFEDFESGVTPPNLVPYLLQAIGPVDNDPLFTKIAPKATALCPLYAAVRPVAVAIHKNIDATRGNGTHRDQIYVPDVMRGVARVSKIFAVTEHGRDPRNVDWFNPEETLGLKRTESADLWLENLGVLPGPDGRLAGQTRLFQKLNQTVVDATLQWPNFWELNPGRFFYQRGEGDKQLHDTRYTDLGAAVAAHLIVLMTPGAKLPEKKQ